MSLLRDYELETAPLPGRSHALPLRAYSDTQIFELEMERIFRRDWIAICGADELASSGDYDALSLRLSATTPAKGSQPRHQLKALSHDNRTS